MPLSKLELPLLRVCRRLDKPVAVFRGRVRHGPGVGDGKHVIPFLEQQRIVP